MSEHRVLITEEQLQKRVHELAEEVNQLYDNHPIDLICILKGAVIFSCDLMRSLQMPVRMHFIQVSSYSTTQTSGAIDFHFSSPFDITDRDVLIVEDILDTGITLDYLIKHLREKNPRSIRICTLLDKPHRRRLQLQPDFVGFKIPDDFVIGYGLDYQEVGRNLRYIAVLQE
jgi:hypoxanthine phosphoribosyltransferase